MNSETADATPAANQGLASQYPTAVAAHTPGPVDGAWVLANPGEAARRLNANTGVIDDALCGRIAGLESQCAYLRGEASKSLDEVERLRAQRDELADVLGSCIADLKAERPGCVRIPHYRAVLAKSGHIRTPG